MIKNALLSSQRLGVRYIQLNWKDDNYYSNYSHIQCYEKQITAIKKCMCKSQDYEKLHELQPFNKIKLLLHGCNL